MNMTDGDQGPDSADEAVNSGDGAHLDPVSDEVADSSAETKQVLEADVSAVVAATEAEMKMIELSQVTREDPED